MNPQPILNRIPGSLFVSAKTDKEKKEINKDITKLSKIELEELLERQKKLLANKFVFII